MSLAMTIEEIHEKMEGFERIEQNIRKCKIFVNTSV